VVLWSGVVCAYLLTGAEEASLRTFDTEGAILYVSVIDWEAGGYARRVWHRWRRRKGRVASNWRGDEESVGLISFPARSALVTCGSTP